MSTACVQQARVQVEEPISEGATSAAWRKALDNVVPCCVVLKVTLTRAVDTEAASSAYASGVVVSKKHGIILTNRHVVTPGPIVAEAIFLNREELPVYPVYFDPVHDFAFLRFDPSKLQFLEIGEVPLVPESAAVGLDIRVVGNDSGEKVSILSGTLARLDRDAPVYGRRGYNDFNTFYLQAASGTKGGSSGSPVIDINGNAVGLNAGGKNKAASAYYLPLERVVRALNIILASKEPDVPWSTWRAPVIPRGDLQTTFVFRGFDEVRRLGLQQETERRMRAAPFRSHGKAATGETQVTGMLVVESVVPRGPCDGVLEAGDCLVAVNGACITHFLTLEEILDDHVGREVTLSLERGGRPIEAVVRVTDLHSVTPSSFLELAGGTVHALSYQQARNNRAAVGQVYVAEPGYMLARAHIPKYAIITSLAARPTPDVVTFAEVLKGLAHGARVPLEYFTFGERHRVKSALLHVNRQWYGPPVHWTRDDSAGLWHPNTDYPPANAPAAAAPAPAGEDAPSTAAAATPAAAAAEAAPCNGTGCSNGAAADAAAPAEEAAADGGKEEQAEGVQPMVVSEPAPEAAPVKDEDVKMEDAEGAPGATAATGAAATTTTSQAEQQPTPNSTPSLRRGRSATAAAKPPVASPAKSTPQKSAKGAKGKAKAAEEADANGSTPAEPAADAPSTFDGETPVEASLRASLVLVDVDIPLVALADGVHARMFAGNGLVVYHGETVGLVLVDRNTVTVGPCDVNISFGAHPAEAPAKVRFLHPLHNFALVSYDPRQLPEEARRKIRAATLAPLPVKRGERVMLAGITKFLRLMQRQSTVTNATAALTVSGAEVPRFRAVHEEVVKLDQDFGATFSGVLTDDLGRVRALWGSYSEQIDKEDREWCAGLPAYTFAPWVERLIAQQTGGSGAPLSPLRVRTLDAELEPLLLSKAAQFALPPDWVSKLDRLDPERRQVLRVRSCVANSHAASVLHSGDMILAVAGKPVTCFRDIEAIIASFGNAAGDAPSPAAAEEPASPAANGKGKRRRGAAASSAGTPQSARKRGSAAAAAAADAEDAAAAAADGQGEAAANGSSEAAPAAAPEAAAANGHAAADAGAGSSAPAAPLVPLTIFRKGQIQEVQVQLGQEDGMGTTRLVHWCGAQLQAPHRSVRELGFLPDCSGVYISRWFHGSPAHRYGLYALHWVAEVNGTPTPDLDAFLEVVRPLRDGDFVRVKVLHLESAQPKVLTLKLDHVYWPTWELKLDAATGDWVRSAISPPHARAAPAAATVTEVPAATTSAATADTEAAAAAPAPSGGA